MSGVQQRKCQLIEKGDELYIKCGRYVLNLGELLRYMGEVIRTNYDAMLEFNEFCREYPVRCWYSMLGESIGILFNFVQYLLYIVERGTKGDENTVREFNEFLMNIRDLDKDLYDRLKAILKFFGKCRLNVFDHIHIERFIDVEKSFKSRSR